MEKSPKRFSGRSSRPPAARRPAVTKHQPSRTKQTRPSTAPSEAAALKRALHFLKSRPRSSFEVAARLNRAGFASHLINSVLERLTAADLLNDARFARDWLLWRDRRRPSGRRLLHHELKQKGLTPPLIAAALAERETPSWFEEVGLVWTGGSIESVQAARLLTGVRAKMNASPSVTTKRRVAQLLSRRGFGGEIIYEQLHAWESESK